MPCRKADDQLAMNCGRAARRHYQAAIRGLSECGDGVLDVIGVADVDRGHVY